MKPNIYWIESVQTSTVSHKGRVAILSRPRPGDWLEDEIISWKNSGVDIVVSLLNTEEIDELSLAEEPRLCKNNGLEYFSFPIADRGCPAMTKSVVDFFEETANRVKNGKTVGVHCRAGIGRSTLFAAAVLILVGVSAQDTLLYISKARGCQIPDTDEQRTWILQFPRVRS